jgi:hypothetical protein
MTDSSRAADRHKSPIARGGTTHTANNNAPFDVVSDAPELTLHAPKVSTEKHHMPMSRALVLFTMAIMRHRVIVSLYSIAHDAEVRWRRCRRGQSCRTTLRSELLILRGISPSYSMKPSFLNLFRKKFTRDRVVPIISASVSCEIFGTTRTGLSTLP